MQHKYIITLIGYDVFVMIMGCIDSFLDWEKNVALSFSSLAWVNRGCL